MKDCLVMINKRDAVFKHKRTIYMLYICLNSIEMVKPILFYDGDCGFCNHVVAFIIKNERKSEISFSSLQSQFAKDIFKEEVNKEDYFDSFKIKANKRVYEKADAVFFLIKTQLKFYFFPLLIFKILPKRMLNAVYNFIAKRRTKMAKPFCWLPSKRDQVRFLD